MVFNSPTLEYSLLAPILIILGGALIGVLIEAFVGKARRPVVQLGVALATLLLALIQVIRIGAINEYSSVGELKTMLFTLNCRHWIGET